MGTFKGPACLDFEHLVATIAVLIDNCSLRRSKSFSLLANPSQGQLWVIGDQSVRRPRWPHVRFTSNSD